MLIIIDNIDEILIYLYNINIYYMSLEANKFLSRLYGEAVADQQRQNKEVKEKVKQVALREVGEVMATKEMSSRDYNFFKRLINNISYEIYQVLQAVADDNINKLFELTSNVISDWNNIVSALSRLKYNYLRPQDKSKVKGDLDELKPSLQQLSSRFQQLAINDNKFSALGERIDNIISQININIYDQVSYPLKESVQLLEEPEEDEPEEDEEEEDGEEEDED